MSDKNPSPSRLGRGSLPAGFESRKYSVEGTSIHFVVGPENGPALLLLPGQGVDWKTYARVMPDLSRDFHVFTVDIHGHGETGPTPGKYSAAAIGADLAAFIGAVIGGSAFVSGNSSGGLLSVWLAANASERVRGIVAEDPPLFSSEFPRIQQTVSYDMFRVCRSYLESGSAEPFARFYVEHAAAFTKVPKKPKTSLLEWLAIPESERPGRPAGLMWALFPASWLGFLGGLTSYDPGFGDAFFDGSWHAGFDHADTLRRVRKPMMLIHANWFYDKNGILMGAMNKDDAARSASLAPGCEFVKVKTGHGMHDEKPRDFARLIRRFAEGIAGV